jgi:hypothetical protein
MPIPTKLFLWIAGFSAALLSVLYIAIYLRGGPRIIDATTYFLQGRALSHGDLAWAVGEPSASFRGRFLLYREGDGVMGGIFPPGYPLLLALGFSIGAPMVVGPALAAAIVVATYRLARTLAERALPREPGSAERVEQVARLAALVSVVCGALRYHTADTMSHGATALGIALALDAALHRRAVIAGLVVGAVVATRPVSAMGIAVVVCAVLATGASADASDGPKGIRPRALADAARPTRARVLVRFAMAMTPGIFVLMLAQHAVTGAWLGSAQKMYYAASDGPPGCFRWGFGVGTGCRYEHGDFVEARLASGYGLVAALGTTLRRLRLHLLDAANLEPLALLVLVPLARVRGATRRSPATLAALGAVLAQVLVYAPFYFDGNYPGGGARLLADVLPVEHALLALAVARLVSAPRFTRGAFALLTLSLAGFAVHASFGHGQLADRDGGRPMFEMDLLARSGVANASLVFVDTDHAFALGHDPAARIKAGGMVVARLRNDDRDRLLYDRLDHPPTYLYRYDTRAAAGHPGEPAVPLAAPWAPPGLGDELRFEAEAEWPALAQTGGFALPIYTEACASNMRALTLTPSPLAGRASARLSVPVPQSGRYQVAVRVVQDARVPHVETRGPSIPNGSLHLGGKAWTWVDIAGGACADLPLQEVLLEAPTATLVLEAEGGAVTLDRITLKRHP